jgi:hypothetical protein
LLDKLAEAEAPPLHDPGQAAMAACSAALRQVIQSGKVSP